MISIMAPLALSVAMMGSTNVYFGLDGSNVVKVDARTIGRPLDVVFDRSKQLLYMYTRNPEGDYISRWSTSGKPGGRWRLPESIRTPNPLTMFNGRVSLRYWDDAKAKGFFFVVPDSDSGVLEVDEAGSYYEDTVQSAQITKEIRSIMRKLQWTPFAHAGVHVGTAASLIDSFMPLEPFTDERIAWTQSYDAISYTWESGRNFHLAVRQGTSGYKDRDISDHILAALDWSPAPTNHPHFTSICVSREAAVYGLQCAEADPDAAVVWIDIHTPNWRVSRTAQGYLARTLLDLSIAKPR